MVRRRDEGERRKMRANEGEGGRIRRRNKERRIRRKRRNRHHPWLQCDGRRRFFIVI
ncbi:MAG: hypothetical protein ACLTBV_14675 [Enterocloster bolteae]